MGSQQTDGPLQSLGSMNFERDVHVPSTAAIGFEKFQLKSRTYEDATFYRCDGGNALIGLP
tara:strand:- start:198 stop:380 length:183 start_codon:yes stop_codon:yes gene_type:complete